MDWLDLLAVQQTFKSLLQHRSSKAAILWHSAFFTVQLSHTYMTTGKTIALTKWNFVGKVMSLLFNMLFRLVITFLPRSKHLFISWAVPFSSGSSQPRDQTQISHIAGRFFTSWATREDQEYWSLSLLQRIFPTQESSWCLLHCRWILYQLSSQGSPK